jgi:hypothetical protein
VTLDAQPVRASSERAGFAARVEDRGDGFLLRVARDPRIRETLPHDLVCLDDGTLCVASESGLSGREREELLPGRVFDAGAAAELVTVILPDLARRMPVEIATRRLPETCEIPPRILLEVEAEGDELRLLPTLVYGDPPRARIDAGPFVPLGGRSYRRRRRRHVNGSPAGSALQDTASRCGERSRWRTASDAWGWCAGTGRRLPQESPLVAHFAPKPGGLSCTSSQTRDGRPPRRRRPRARLAVSGRPSRRRRLRAALGVAGAARRQSRICWPPGSDAPPALPDLAGFPARR